MLLFFVRKVTYSLNWIPSAPFYGIMGYPESIIQTIISKKIALFNGESKEGPQKCPVYLKLPRMDKISSNMEKQTKPAINQYYVAVESRIISKTRKILPAISNDVLSFLQQSIVVYQYAEGESRT